MVEAMLVHVHHRAWYMGIVTAAGRPPAEQATVCYLVQDGTERLHVCPRRAAGDAGGYVLTESGRRDGEAAL
jgi:hypothetical protein